MQNSGAFSKDAVDKRSAEAARALDAAARSAKAKRELNNAAMDKKERRPLKEFTDFRAELSEHVGVPAHSIPPNILILRRKTIRQFPNNVMVALYFNDKLGQYFSIPYGSVAPDDAVITPIALKEEYRPGDTVRYLSGNNLHLQVGRVVSHDPSHLVVKRGKYHYRVARTHVMHNDRTGRSSKESLGEETTEVLNDAVITPVALKEEELNEISIATASRALKARMDRSQTNLAKSELTRGRFWKNEFGKRALTHFQKAQKTAGDIGRKVDQADADSRARVADITKRAEETFAKSVSSSRGGASAALQHSQHSRGHLNEAGSHRVGDAVRYRVGSESHLRLGLIKKVMPDHLIVKRRGAHHKVPNTHVVYNTRTGYTREEHLNEDAISHLQKVKAFKTSEPLYHKDGSQTKIDPTTANALLTVHGALHPDNRKKFADALEHSKPKFHKMLDFAWKQVK